MKWIYVIIIMIYGCMGEGIIKAQNVSSMHQSIESYLISIGVKFNIRFTIESSHSERMEYAEITTPLAQSELISFPDFISGFGKLMPSFVIQEDPGNANVYHIIQKDLLDQKDYYLNKNVPGLNFNGTIPEYVKYLDAGHNALFFDLNRSLDGRPLIIDVTSVVNITTKNKMSVREALSLAFPSKYAHILWSAATIQKTNRTYLMIPGSSAEPFDRWK